MSEPLDNSSPERTTSAETDTNKSSNSQQPPLSTTPQTKKPFTFSNFLNVCGAVIILCVILIFFKWLMGSIAERNEKKDIQINFSFQEKKIPLRDSSIITINNRFITDLNLLKDTLNNQIEKLQSLKKDINEGESRNSDLFKLLLALIGTVFAIVGFFGFKSINDAREAALKTVLSEARTVAESKAKEIADLESKKIAGEKAKEVATEIASTVSVKTSEKESRKYLDENLPKLFGPYEQAFMSNSESKFADFLDRLDKLEHPEAYGIGDPIVEELKQKYTELLTLVNSLQLNELKKKIK